MFVSFLSSSLDASFNTLLENEQLREKDVYFSKFMFSQSMFHTPVHKKKSPKQPETNKTINKQTKKTQHKEKPHHFSQLTSTTPTCITI